MVTEADLDVAERVVHLVFYGPTWRQNSVAEEIARHRTASTAALTAEIQRLREKVGKVADLIDVQAGCLEGYAESSGHPAKPVPSVFHFQATHFRDLATEIRTALSTPSEVSEQVQAQEGEGSFGIAVAVLGPHQHQWAYGTATGGISCVKCQETRAYDHPDTRAYLAALKRGSAPSEVSEPVADPCPHCDTDMNDEIQHAKVCTIGEAMLHTPVADHIGGEGEAPEPFGYWVEQKHAEPFGVLLRKPAYIPEPSPLRTVTPLYATTPNTNGDAVREALPEDIAKLVLDTGRAEWGQTPAHDAEGHAAHIADSVRMTAEHFGQTEPQNMHGVYIDGTGIVICHTGTSPNSPQIARALTGAWNWLYDQALATLAKHGGATNV